MGPRRGVPAPPRAGRSESLLRHPGGAPRGTSGRGARPRATAARDARSERWRRARSRRTAPQLALFETARGRSRRPCRRSSRACSTKCGASTPIASRRSTRSRCCTGSPPRCARETLRENAARHDGSAGARRVRTARVKRPMASATWSRRALVVPDLQPRRGPGLGADRARGRRGARRSGRRQTRAALLRRAGDVAGKRFSEPIRVGDGLLRQVRVGQIRSRTRASCWISSATGDTA